MQLWYDSIMCEKCGSLLIPIVYGQVNPVVLEMARYGRVIIGDDGAIDRPTFYCAICTEAF